MITFLLGLTLFAPAIGYVVFAQPSMATGVLAFCLVHIGVGIRILLAMTWTRATWTSAHAVAAYLIITIIPQQDGHYEKIVEVVALYFLYLAAWTYFKILSTSDFCKVLKVFRSLCKIQCVIGFLGVIMPLSAILGYAKFAKAVFPFAEPSHYALAAGPICIVVGVTSTSRIRLLLMIITGALALLLQSVVMLAFTILMSVMFFPRARYLTLGLFLVPLLGVLLLKNYSGLTYFTERLDFVNSTNLTSLTYIQGWDDARRSVAYGYGFGTGFQSMGILAPSELSETIYSLSGKYLNKNDGSFVASKLISEFGIVGMVIVFSYLVFAYNAARFVIDHSKRYDPSSLHRLIGASLVVGFIPEMFFRGYGYFSPGVFLFFVGAFLFGNTQCKEKFIFA
ncbi:hypothetical protein MasN3_41270 [Massilia varians]|uniref:O-antigen ligase domain-containing protein n=1 Tax=Massilia varians TaxID=457921 RepID=A0ABM8CBG2_9BURK|nr:hypothetical protein [Massilia varians]BDT60633.1 hypothetical protein MasN3_41270 [Massilia varians]